MTSPCNVTAGHRIYVVGDEEDRMGDEGGSRAGRPGYRKLIWAALAVAVTLTACGPGGAAPATGGFDGPSDATDGVGRAAPPTAGHPADALAKWQAFPVTADPRPLILTNGAVIDPATGFLTDEGKLAYLAGNFELATTAPAAPTTSAGYTIISATAALSRLRAAGNSATGNNQPATRPLRIVEVSLVQASFGTDRGPQALPAWRFQLDQVNDPVQVLAIDSQYLWRSTVGGPTGMDHRASLSGDGLSLSVSFYGSPVGPPPCGADYTADVAESRTAVVVTPRRITPNGQVSSSEAVCTTIAARRTVTVRLAAPLGARVLLTAEGSAIPVSSTG
jgi:hypothetical protein